MKILAVEFPLARLCELFELSRSGYYAWLKRKPSQRQRADQQLLPHVQRAYEEGRGTYGQQKAAFRPRTTDSNHEWPIAPNRLKDTSPPQAPDQVWVSDITYIATMQGWLYLAVVMDLCSRKIIGWALADHLKTPLVTAALRRALAARRPSPGLVHHSDRGVQYASGDYQNLLAAWHILPSMSAKGNCYDNAAIEAFFSTLKRDLIHRQRWHSARQVQLALFDYLESFYNRKRLHSSLGYCSPAQFEKSLVC